MTQKPNPPPPSNQKISRQLERMLSSPDFNATEQQTALLNFVVNRALSGKEHMITDYTAATEVFDRGPEFDQRRDPVVSIQASLLRRALKRYYLTAGKRDSVRIDIPRDSRVPVFENRLVANGTAAINNGERSDIHTKSFLPAVLVCPLRNLSGDPEIDFWGIGLSTELADELNRYPDIRVMTLSSVAPHTKVDRRAAQFVIDGSVRSDGTYIKMILNLTDTQSGIQIWSYSGRSEIAAAKLISFQEDIARRIAVRIAGERGWIMKTLGQASKRRPPQHAVVYEAVLRYFEYDVTFESHAFSRALAALEKAVIIEPEYGPGWSALARLYGDIYAFDIPRYKDPLDKALEYAQNGTRLSPNNQRCRVALAYIHLFRNDLRAGRAEAEQALKLGPETLFMLDGIGYLLTLMGDWERGSALIAKVIRLNPFYGNYVHFALWGNYLAQKDYEGACRETMKLNRPALFWDHLARAATLGLLGNIEDGRKAAAKLLELKPNFAARGRILIGHYIKFKVIIERIIDGLKAVGVEVR